MNKIVVQRDHKLQRRAELLWPDNEHNQREWLRAVGVVRLTQRGWLAESHLRKQEKA